MLHVNRQQSKHPFNKTRTSQCPYRSHIADRIHSCTGRTSDGTKEELLSFWPIWATRLLSSSLVSNIIMVNNYVQVARPVLEFSVSDVTVVK